MISTLKKHGRYTETLFMLGLCAICFALSAFRVVYAQSGMYLFLNWNLFLAFIPWMLTSFLIIKPTVRVQSLLFIVVACTWMLFFPNAPYILTDLFHLKDHSTTPIWFDLVLVLSFAWTGLLFGFLSLWDLEKILSRNLPSRSIRLLVTAMLFVGSYGIYVGRYLRWNSWDILREPMDVLTDVGSRLLFPMQHPRAWGMTLAMGLLLNMMYWSFRFIKQRNDVTVVS
ncbi:MAG: DUF1361 domain-containing protein [Candidatus Kapabacteria bacterium]|nr:DUF1361 domain-containing protein [Candidatus Kapabacteria bacterium]